jgi:hypothetical protein
MGTSPAARVAGDADVARHSLQQLTIRFRAGTWQLTDEGASRMGGMFSSLSSAVDYARGELRGVRGGRIVLELDGPGCDGQP